MRPARRVFVVGGAQTDFLGRGHPRWVSARDAPGPTIEDLLCGSIRDALDATGVPAAEVDTVVVGNFLGECFARQGHLSAMALGAHPDLDGTPAVRVEAACASGGLAVLGCVHQLAAGMAEVALAAGVEVETHVRGRDGVEFVARAAHMERQRHLDFALFPYLFARRAQAYRARYGSTREDTARVVAKAHRNAADNPYALQQAVPLTAEDVLRVDDDNRLFLTDPDLRPHMTTRESTAFTDGAAAVLLATERGLARLGVDPADCTEILAVGHRASALGAPTDPLRMDNMAAAAQVAYRAAGIGPSDLGVAEVHDCFAITELQAIEALGFCDPGDAPRLMREGRTERAGAIPVNPSGGLLGGGHPIGATGVRQVLDVWRQLLGKAGPCQVSGHPQLGVTANLGGDDKTAVVMVHTQPRRAG